MSLDSLSDGLFAEVLLPLAIPKTYSYGVPVEMHKTIQFGIRVEVPLRNKLYSGIVISLSSTPPPNKFRNVITILDDAPIIQREQFEFWEWIAKYYCAPLGSVMNIALPSGLKLASETRLLFNHNAELDGENLSDDEYLIAEAISIQGELTISLVQDILNKKTVYPIIKNLLQKRILIIKEELKPKFKPKEEDFLLINPGLDEDANTTLIRLERSEKQSRAFLSFLTLAKRNKVVPKKAVFEMAGVDNSVIKALVKKGVLLIEKRVVSRISNHRENEPNGQLDLSPQQLEAANEINAAFADQKTVLLHGITGSGKTQIYIELIQEVLKSGGQALYLLPEIALTSQIVERLSAQIEEDIFVYHSQVNDNKRVETWNAALIKNRLFIGARSSLFLPFYNLKLIIVDEEHDSSYKQENPSPRYHARDSAIVLGQRTGANVILGTATPSLESIRNAQQGKFRLVTLESRFGGAVLPDVKVIDLKDAYKKGLIKDGFSRHLIEAIDQTTQNKEQVIIFQNRRGYAPVISCNFCDWKAECPNCDVSLTYHQRFNELKCHYCGYRSNKKNQCPSCGNSDLRLIGFGTEKIMEALSEQLPHLKIARFDHDTTRSRKNQEKILYEFKTGKIDVLIGTQMITKGFDFDNIGLVGVMSADGLLSYPDFRSAERTFQLLMQVSGRAGRREQQGKVLIQAFNIDHPVLKQVISANYDQFFDQELKDRELHRYPPFYHLICVWFAHKDMKRAKAAAKVFSQKMSALLGGRVSHPIDPPVVRIRNRFRQMIYIKSERTTKMSTYIKLLILSEITELKQDKEHKSVSMIVDVDSY